MPKLEESSEVIALKTMTLTQHWMKNIYHTVQRVMARGWLHLFPQVTTIGITGSVGKTTTKEAIAAVLSQKFEVVKSKANLDPVYNIPITLLRLRPNTQMIVLEMGVEFPHEMSFYLSIVQPSVGVITKIDWTHTEFFGDLEGVKREKEQLIFSLPQEGYAVLNWDDEIVRNLAQNIKARVFYFGSDSNQCHLWFDHVEPTLKSTQFQLHYGRESVEVHYPLLGTHQLTSALAAASVGIINNLNLLTIRRGLETMKPSEHRFTALHGPNGSIIVDDTYNASPVASLAALKAVSGFPSKRRIAILGEMKELGKYAEKGHRLVGEELVRQKFHTLVAYGTKAKMIAEGAKEYSNKNGARIKIYQMTDIYDILDWINRNALEGDIILIKGSRHKIHLERLVAGLSGKDMVVNCLVCPEFATVQP